jgi:hypothetical protein
LPIRAQFSTGTGGEVRMRQQVRLPRSPFELSFEFDFSASTGALELLLGDVVSGPFDGFDAGLIRQALDPLALFQGGPNLPDEMPLAFAFSGPADSTARIDNLVLPNLLEWRIRPGLFRRSAVYAGRGWLCGHRRIRSSRCV